MLANPNEDEINCNFIPLAGVALTDIKGFRAPFLNYSTNTLELLTKAGFTYDSSGTSSQKHGCVLALYLDYANDSLSVPGVCDSNFTSPGFWEFPMCAQFDDRGVESVHLMDPWL